MGLFDFLKRKKKMTSPEELQSIKDHLSKYKSFQWIKTERVGQVTHLKDVVELDGVIYVEFTNDSRVNYDLMPEYVLSQQYGDEPIDMELSPKVSAKVSANGTNQGHKKPDSPIHALLKKQKENRVSIEIQVDLNVPSPELYAVLSQSFDNAEDEIVSYALLDLNMEVVRKAVGGAIKKYYGIEEEVHD